MNNPEELLTQVKNYLANEEPNTDKSIALANEVSKVLDTYPMDSEDGVYQDLMRHYTYLVQDM